MKKRWQIHLENLEKEILARENELVALNQIDKYIINEQIDLQEVYGFILGKTKDLLQTKYVQLLIRKGDRLEVVASTDPANVGVSVFINDSVCGLSIQSGKIINSVDVTEGRYSEVYQDHFGTKEEPMISELVAPIIVDGSPIGVINIESPMQAAFDSRDERIASALASQAGLAIVHARLFDEVSLFTEIKQFLFSDSRDAALQGMLHVIVRKLQELLTAQSAPISIQVLFLKADGDLEIAYSSNPENVGISLKIGDSIPGRAIAERKLVVVEDVSKEPRYKRMLGEDQKSEIAVPIIGQGQAVGVIAIESPDTGAFDSYFQYILQRFSQEVSNMLMLAKLKDDLQRAREYQQATEVLVAIGDQAANIIHRLNNTVVPMKVWLREIQFSCREELDENEFLRDRINDLTKSAEEALRLPQEVKWMIRTEFTDINATLQETLREVEIPENIAVELNLELGLPRIQCYSFDIVARNLIQNAIDAMPDRGCLKVSSKLISYDNIDDRYVEIKVEDTGKGIPEDEIPNIFSINYTTKKEKVGKGLGFGLWWVKNFVTRVKGDIYVRTREGEGTTFVIRLPVSQ